MAEEEAEYRHKTDNKALKILGIGQIFAFVTTVLSLGAVVLSMFFSQPVASIAPTIVAITGLASLFINRNKY
ncbi:MAG: hypothetical protein Ta2F_05590 [Termitinemataceae bacterium]|nr:MAG: hypothetical protein Ta2F_05590 [Termitinemataceae bacterium]